MRLTGVLVYLGQSFSLILPLAFYCKKIPLYSKTNYCLGFILPGKAMQNAVLWFVNDWMVLRKLAQIPIVFFFYAMLF